MDAQDAGKKDKPSSNNAPPIANIKANLHLGSARNKPFQFACIAHIDNGRYVIQKTRPVRPQALDHWFLAWLDLRLTLFSKPISPINPATRKENSDVHTHAPWR